MKLILQHRDELRSPPSHCALDHELRQIGREAMQAVAQLVQITPPTDRRTTDIMADSRLPDLATRMTASDLDHVYSELKKAIMMGEFEPGQKLKLAELAEAFGTSQMPVREALGRLASAGALESAQRRSMVVPTADFARLRAILSLRIDLEGNAVRLAMQSGRDGRASASDLRLL